MLDIALALPVFLLGIVFLYKGSDILVDGTARIAVQLGISSLIISVVLVGFGTSSPEFAISVGAAIQENSDISLGNIIGSCIANLLLVLGLSAVIRPITIQRCIIKREAPIMIGATLLLLVLAYMNFLDTYRIIGGIILLVAFFAFVFFFIRCAQKERQERKTHEKGTKRKNLLFIILGTIGVVLGAYLLIESSICIAYYLGIPTFVIALSMVAVGTSLPELVVSIVAAYRKESDIAVGNVLGSNVFNICLILGVSALFIPLHAADSLLHLIILLLVTILMFLLLYTKHTLSRIEGIGMLILYTVFIVYIFFLS